jgi:hypothetical protein
VASLLLRKFGSVPAFAVVTEITLIEKGFSGSELFQRNAGVVNGNVSSMLGEI